MAFKVRTVDDLKRKLNGSENAAESTMGYEWDGVPPHHFIDMEKPQNGVWRVSLILREEARPAAKDFDGSFTQALKHAIATRYALVMKHRETHPRTLQPWELTDVPAPYRPMAARIFNGDGE